jgi:hypothetical protein
MIHKGFVIPAQGNLKVNLKPAAIEGFKRKLNRKSQAPPDLKIGPNKSQLSIFKDQNNHCTQFASLRGSGSAGDDIVGHDCLKNGRWNLLGENRHAKVSKKSRAGKPSR